MFRAAAARDKGLRPAEIYAAFKVPKNKEFLMNRAADNLRRYDYKKLDLSLSALLEAERRIKSYSSDSRIIFEELIVKLIYIMKTGEAL